MPSRNPDHGPCGGMARRRRGRPVQIGRPERMEMVLDATQVLLTEKRLGEVTMAAIAQRAGMSKRTLYGMFDSREALLEACIERLSRSIFRPLTPADSARPLAHRLRTLLTINAGPETAATAMELMRALIVEANSVLGPRRPACDGWLDWLEHAVAHELREGVRQGEIGLTPERIPLAAKIVIDMAFGNPLPFLLRPDMPRPGPEQKAARRDWAVEIFLGGLERQTDIPSVD